VDEIRKEKVMIGLVTRGRVADNPLAADVFLAEVVGRWWLAKKYDP
jgi:hypothetical protein